MRAGPFQEFRLRRHVGKPQRHAVVMRDGNAQALWRKRQSTDGRGHVEGFVFALPLRTNAVLPADHATAPSGCSATLSIQRRLASVASTVTLAFGIERDQLAVVATGDDTLAVGCRAQHRAAMNGDTRNRVTGILVRGIDDRRVLLGADEDGVVAEEINRRHGHADRQRPHPVGDGNDGRSRVRIKISHHVVIQLSKPSRMVCSGNSRPMKTRRLSRGSSSRHLR